VVPSGSDWTVNSPVQGIVSATAYNSSFGNYVVIEIKNDVKVGTIDQLTMLDGYINVGGWSFDSTVTGTYRYVFVMDSATGIELGRLRVDKSVRNDVCVHYNNVANCKNSGFYAKIPITSNMLGKTIFIMARYTNDPAGNNPKSDHRFNGNKLTIPLNLSVIREGNYVYYLNSNGTINYAEEYNGAAKIKQYHFYTNTNYNGNQWNHVSYEFILKADGLIDFAKRYEDNTKIEKSRYVFYSGTKMNDNYWKRIEYEYGLDNQGNVTYMRNYYDNTDKQIITLTTFYENTKFDSNRNNHTQTIVSFDENANIKVARWFENNTKKEISQVFYYPNTKYDTNRRKHVQYQHYFDGNGYITQTNNFEDRTNKLILSTSYYPNTKYDTNRVNHIKYDFRYNTDGETLAWARLYKDGTNKETMAIFTFYPGVANTSDRWNRVQFKYVMKNGGVHIDYAYRYDNGDTNAKIKYTFAAGTVYDSYRWDYVVQTEYL